MRASAFLHRRHVLLGGSLLGVAGLSGAGPRALAQASTSEDPWPSLARQIFDDHVIGDGSAVLAIDAPYRAEDAAVVPVELRLAPPEGNPRHVARVTLVIDQNPSPLAAVFTFGETSGIRALSTRARVDSYTNLHAIATMEDGALLGTKRFVKAAGGCSAPAAKQEAGSIPLGTMRFRQFATESGAERREAQLMIRHPNFTGMQMDQLTRLYVPAHFVSSVRIWQGDELLLGVDSGISIAENPEFRFDFRPNGAAEFRAEVKDSEGKVFKDSWSAVPA